MEQRYLPDEQGAVPRSEQPDALPRAVDVVAPDQPRQAISQQVLLQPCFLEPHRGGRLEVAHAVHVAHQFARRTAVCAQGEHEELRPMPPDKTPQPQCDLHGRRADEGRTAASAAAGLLHQLAGIRKSRDDAAGATIRACRLPGDDGRAGGCRHQHTHRTKREPRLWRHRSILIEYCRGRPGRLCWRAKKPVARCIQPSPENVEAK